MFDDVFIPNEYIYMNGESEFATVMVERFAGYHRQSYGGCKVGVGDVLIGAAAAGRRLQRRGEGQPQSRTSSSR